MARAHEIAIGADAKDFDRGIRDDVIKPLDDAEEKLEDLERAAKGADLDKGIEKAQKETKKLTDELDDARSTVKGFGKAAGDAGDDAKRGMKGASDGVKEMGEEASQSAKETAASFSDVTDALDLVQELAANALSGFGPAGVIAGAAVAVGIGLATSAFQAAEEAAEEARQKAVEYAGEAHDAGVDTETWVTSAQRMVERIQELEELKSKDWRWFWEDDPSQLEDWADALQRMGRSTEEIGDVLSGTTDEIEEYRKAVEKSRDATYDEIKALVDRNKEDPVDGYVDRVNALNDQYKAHGELIDQLDEEISLRDQSAESYDRQKAAGIDAAAAEAAAVEEKASRIAAAEEAVEQSALSAYDTMRSAAYNKATADDAAFDTNKWLEYVEQTRVLADGYKANLANMQLTPEEWENFLALPEDARNNIAASYQSAGEDGKQRIRTALSDTGSTAGNEATVGFNDAFQPDAEVAVEADTSEAERDLTKLADKKRTAEIEVKTTGKKAAETDLDDLAKKRSATIEAKADMSSATSTMATWRRSQEARPITITVLTRTGRTQLV